MSVLRHDLLNAQRQQLHHLPRDGKLVLHALSEYIDIGQEEDSTHRHALHSVLVVVLHNVLVVLEPRPQRSNRPVAVAQHHCVPAVYALACCMHAYSRGMTQYLTSVRA